MQPPTEKVDQIMARIAIFVSKHGGKSEIVLRVKQGDNPTFGFLMPDHRLHPVMKRNLKGFLWKNTINQIISEENVGGIYWSFCYNYDLCLCACKYLGSFPMANLSKEGFINWLASMRPRSIVQAGSGEGNDGLLICKM